MFSRTEIESLTEDLTFSIIFKPETNLRELYLVARDQKTKESWVSVIRHLVTKMGEITSQESHDMWVLTSSVTLRVLIFLNLLQFPEEQIQTS